MSPDPHLASKLTSDPAFKRKCSRRRGWPSLCWPPRVITLNGLVLHARSVTLRGWPQVWQMSSCSCSWSTATRPSHREREKRGGGRSLFSGDKSQDDDEWTKANSALAFQANFLLRLTKALCALGGRRVSTLIAWAFPSSDAFKANNVHGHALAFHARQGGLRIARTFPVLGSAGSARKCALEMHSFWQVLRG